MTTVFPQAAARRTSPTTGLRHAKNVFSIPVFSCEVTSQAKKTNVYPLLNDVQISLIIRPRPESPAIGDH
jgi:hypothetical protein